MFSKAVERQIRLQPQRIESFGMIMVCLLRNVFHGDAAHPADGSAEIFVYDAGVNADGLKNPRALVGLYGGDTHLGGDLHNAMKHGAVVVVYSGIVILV